MQAFNLAPPGYEILDRNSVRKRLSNYQRQSGFSAFAIKEGGRVAGAALVTDDREKTDYLFLQEIFVNPSFQNKGFGRQLLKSIVDYAVENNYQGTRLLVDSRNIPAMKLYQNSGFEALEIPRVQQFTQQIFELNLQTQSDGKKLTNISLPAGEDTSYYLNQREVKGAIMSKLVKPELTDTDQKMVGSVLQEVVSLAVAEGVIQKMAYDTNRQEWFEMFEKSDDVPTLLRVLDAQWKAVIKTSRFVVEMEKMANYKTQNRELIIRRLLDSFVTNNRFNLVCFVCASYERDFKAVSNSSETNRLRFFEEGVRNLQDLIKVSDLNGKITLLFSDTDYEFYPLPRTEGNSTNYRRQYVELSEFVGSTFDPKIVRLMKWSDYKKYWNRQFIELYDKARSSISPKTELTDPVQMAYYSAQACLLPKGSVIIVMESPNYNSYYDQLTTESANRIPKFQPFNIEEYKKWIK
jgi:GNAT superfamily N-acetyltransferase